MFNRREKEIRRIDRETFNKRIARLEERLNKLNVRLMFLEEKSASNSTLIKAMEEALNKLTASLIKLERDQKTNGKELKLSVEEVIVLAIFGEYPEIDGGISYKRIFAIGSLSRGKLSYALSKLVKKGLIEKVGHGVYKKANK